MASSIHTPLQGDGRGFRLLVLEPSADRLAPLRCELNRASFDDKDLKYTALSYAWGDPLATTPIFVNAVQTQVTLNLEAALRHIRQPSHAVILWVDALCINQEDLAEKNHQVEMMREIFSGAELVIAWLGSADEDSDLAMGVFRKGLKVLMELEGARNESDGKDGPGHLDSCTISNGQGVDLSSECQEEYITTPSPQKAAMAAPQLQNPAALVTGAPPDLVGEHRDKHHTTDQPSVSSISPSFISRDLASRQDDRSFDELLDSKEAPVLMKEYTMAFKQLTTRELLAMWKLLKRSWWCRVWVVQEVLLAKKVIFKCGDAEAPEEQMSSWRGDALFVLDRLCAAHDSTGHIFPALSLLGSIQDPLIEPASVMDYLLYYGMRVATRPHDHIYGLLGIIPASHQNLLGAPDYGCKVEDLFIKVTTKLMVEDNSLQLLRAAGLSAPLRATSPKRLDLPSWVPDWTTHCWNENLRNFTDMPAPFPKPAFSFSEDLRELTVTGCKFDIVESTQLMPPLAQGRMPFWQSVLVTDACTRDDQEPPPLQMLLYALFGEDWPDEFDMGFGIVAAFLQELEEYRICVSRPEAGGGHENPDYLGGFLDWIGETRDGRTDEEILQKVYSAKTARTFLTWYHGQSNEDLQYGYMLYSMLRDGIFGTAGFSIFRASKGSFGITSSAVATGDIICAVPSCPLPLVLRKTVFSKYLLLGPVGGLSRPTFWLLTQAVEKGETTCETFTLV